MDVRVRRLVEVVHRGKHLTRLLRADCGIEVRERLAVEVLLEDREVRPELVSVEGRLRRRYGHRAIVLRRVRGETSLTGGAHRFRFNTLMRASRLLVLTAAAAVLTGCGGGSGATPPAASSK